VRPRMSAIIRESNINFKAGWIFMGFG